MQMDNKLANVRMNDKSTHLLKSNQLISQFSNLISHNHTHLLCPFI